MDRDFRNPEDVARTASEQVLQSLAKILRRGVEDKSFFMRARFEFSGGRSEPVLFIGTLNRAWRDYINGNARANDMIIGSCSTGRGETGRTLIHLTVERGRGDSDSNLFTLNRVLRDINAEAVFAGASATGSAGDKHAGRVRPELAPASAPDSVLQIQSEQRPDDQSEPGTDVVAADGALDLEAEAERLKQLFAAFKAAPTTEKLDELKRLVDAWNEAANDDPLMLISQESELVEKLGKLLDSKGAQFVAQRSG
jgi:hypothetical protein